MAEPNERLEDRLARLEVERREADRRYNDALTALDQALQTRPAFPDAPPPYDPSKLPDVNRVWDLLPAGPPAIDGSIKGRVRGFIWRLVGPALEGQRQFNAAVVDHLNRNVASHERTQDALARLIAITDDHVAGQIQFQGHLIQLLQQVTLYVDTKDRSSASGQEVLNAGLSAISDSWLKRWESLTAREERFVKRAASIDDLRVTTALAQQTALSLKREVERLLAGAHDPAGGPGGPPGSAGPVSVDLESFKYLGFEDQFRGSAADISRRLAEYVPLFDGLSDVLDMGCGRGEFLDLLRASGTSGRGVDLNHAMVEECRRRGLDVAETDALTYLQGLPDASLGGLFAAQVVEHLAPDYLGRLLETAGHKLRPGGVIVLETINPACWLAFFESYIRDLTHVRPLHPDTLQYLLRVSGFQDVSIAYKSPVADAARLQPVPPAEGGDDPAFADLVATFNENAAKLNARLFTYMDYAAVGRKVG